MTKVRLAHALVRLYPRQWRDRYEDELLALLASDAATISGLVDLFRGAIREQLRRLATSQMTRRSAESLAVMGTLFATGATLNLLALPVAGWLDGHGWHPGHDHALAYAVPRIFFAALAGARSLGPALLAGREDPGSEALTDLFAVRRIELVVWIAAAFVAAVFVRFGELDLQRQPWNAHSGVLHSWRWAVLMGGVRLQLLASGTSGAVRHVRQTRASLAARAGRPPRISLGLSS